LAGRFGGEEFIVVLYRSAYEIGMSVAERIRLRIAEMSVPTQSEQKIHVTTSIGVSTFSPFGMTSIDQILSQADQALYKAKDNGRNRVVHFDCLTDTEFASHETIQANVNMYSRQDIPSVLSSS
jgi:diguanylate cyclase (GGDEF)-like protein